MATPMTSPRPWPRGRTRFVPRIPTPWLLALAGVLVFSPAQTAPAPGAAQGTPPGFRVEPDTLRADETGVWQASMRIENKGAYGIYADSLAMEWRSDDVESGDAPRSGLTPLMGIVQVIAPAGAGESTGMEWTAPAEFERGTLVFHLVTHDFQKHVFHSTARVVVAGSLFYDLYPRELLKQGNETVEVVVMPADTVARPAPGLVYVPAAGVSARAAMRAAFPLRGRGMTVALVSLPGTGRSSGRPDRAGPASVAAVEAAIGRLAREPSVDAKRLAVWGMNEGATSALLAAVKHPELQAVVAQDAAYDPWVAYRALAPAAREKYVREAGSDSAGWRARSPLAAAAGIPAPVLVLQTNEPGAPDSTSAQAFAHVRSDQQLFIEARIGAQGGKPFLRRDALRVAQDFLNRRLKHP